MGDTLLDRASLSIKALTPYKPGKPIADVKRDFGLTTIIKLASNENPLGPSPLIRQTLLDVQSDLSRYPDGNAYELKCRLATLHNCRVEQITVGNGTNELLNMLARLFLKPAVSAIYSEHAFIVYKLAVKSCGANAIEVPAVNFSHDLSAIARAITPDTRVIFLANPNNPTGTYFGLTDFTHFMSTVPANVLVVLDEAYFDYVEHKDSLNGTTLLDEYPNLVVTRTFSKVYGLGGLRIGYCLSSSELADLLNRHREPFNVNTVAQLSALIAIDDNDHIKQTLALNQSGMLFLQEGIQDLGLTFIPSSANFISINVGDGVLIADKLLACGVIVRAVAEYDMSEYIRVTIGTKEENQRFLLTLKQVLNDLR